MSSCQLSWLCVIRHSCCCMVVFWKLVHFLNLVLCFWHIAIVVELLATSAIALAALRGSFLSWMGKKNLCLLKVGVVERDLWSQLLSQSRCFSSTRLNQLSYELWLHFGNVCGWISYSFSVEKHCPLSEEVFWNTEPKPRAFAPFCIDVNNGQRLAPSPLPLPASILHDTSLWPVPHTPNHPARHLLEHLQFLPISLETESPDLDILFQCSLISLIRGWW